MWLFLGIAIITLLSLIILFFMGVSASKPSTCPRCGEKGAMVLIDKSEVLRVSPSKNDSCTNKERRYYKIVYRCKRCYYKVIRRVEEEKD